MTTIAMRPDTARRLLAALALALAAAACGPRVGRGALAPAPERVTNEVMAADLATLDAWDARAERLRRLEREREPSPARRYAIAAATEWLGFARDEYALDARRGVSDAALAEARRRIEALEREELPAPLAAAPAFPGTTPVLPEMWAALAEARAGAALALAPEQLGEMEVELVRAGRVGAGTERARCTPALHVAHAGELLLRVRAAGAPPAVLAMGPLPAPSAHPKSSQAQSEPPRPARAAAPALVADLRWPPIVVRSVHFALGSSALSPESRALLDRIADLLRGREGLVLVLEGHADPRGTPERNHELSRDRAAAVRAHLVAAGLDARAISILPFGEARRRAAGASTLAFALDRRVEIRVFPADAGHQVEEQPLDLQEETPRRR